MEQTELLYNKGIIAVNMPKVSALEKTVIVLGVARGGTSMVAGALHHLGISMGERLSAVYEDVELSEAIEQNRNDEIISLIARNNDAHQLWGWKRPSAIKHISAWQGRFRNPHYVVVFRDVFAIANRNRLSMLSDVMECMQDAVSQFRLILNFVEKVEVPTLLISYEKAMSDPQDFVRNLSAFVGINDTTSVDKAISFIEPNPEAYLKTSRITDAKGVLDIAKGNRISGWAMYSQAPKRIAKLLVKINDDKEFTIQADRFRKDLLEKGIHPTGDCGFLLTLPPTDTLQPGDVVRMRVIGDIKELKRSPMVVSN